MTRVWIWRGFRHEWLRTVLGFRTPHRISLLTSMLRDGTFTMGQNTGVDGNFMEPVGRYTRVDADGVVAKTVSHRFAWTDEATSGRYPVAESCRSVRVHCDIEAASAVVLSGFSLQTRCDPAKQVGTPGNSDGMWPHRFRLTVGDLEATDSGASFEVSVEIARSWTPNHGGIPHVAPKPFNSHLDFELEVAATVLGGEGVHAEVLPSAEWSGRARFATPIVHRSPLPSRGTYAVGLSSFGFELSPHRTEGLFEHRGRYIGTLDFGVSLTPDSIESSGQVGVPVTVWDSVVDYHLSPVLLAFDHAEIHQTQTTGHICCPSQNAPWWSAWNRCGPSPRQTDTILLP